MLKILLLSSESSRSYLIKSDASSLDDLISEFFSSLAASLGMSSRRLLKRALH